MTNNTFAPIPDGDYVCEIAEAKEGEKELSFKGERFISKFISIRFRIIKGRSKNRLLFMNIYPEHKSEFARAKALDSITTLQSVTGKQSYLDFPGHKLVCGVEKTEDRNGKSWENITKMIPFKEEDYDDEGNPIMAEEDIPF